MTFHDYRNSYPGLPLAILDFFEQQKAIVSIDGSNGNRIVPKTIQEFLEHLHRIRPDLPYPQPAPIDIICKKLCDKGYLSFAGVSPGVSIDGLNNTYIGILNDAISRVHLSILLENTVYGWLGVYENMQSAVCAIQHQTRDGDLSIGTCFHVHRNLIVTARHCVENAASLSIHGVSPEALRAARLYVSRNEALDLAIIVGGEQPLHHSVPVLIDEGSILDEVLVLGYPNIPGYLPHLAGEKALVSSRFTALRGAIASQPRDIFSREDLFLITARVRGGFSGGPVLSANGGCVGIISRSPISETESSELAQKYDNLGYGTAIPSSFVLQMLQAIKDSNESFVVETKDAGGRWTEYQ